MDTDTQGMSPDEIALMAELPADGLPAEMESEVANRQALERPADDDTDPATAPAPAPAPAAPAPAPAANAPAPVEAPAPAPAAVADTDDAFQAPYAVEMPADAENQIKTLRAEEADAFAKLMDGDMTAEAYREIKDRTDAAARAIDSQVLTATVLSAANEQSAAAEWKRSEAAEFNAFKTEGLDYRAKPALLAAYNVNLKALAAVPENETKSAAWFLREAHKLTKSDLGITSAPVPSPAPAPPARGVDRGAIPPTLSRVPPAVDPNVAGDEFSHMASLKGAEAERAYAAMTPEQQERYLDA